MTRLGRRLRRQVGNERGASLVLALMVVTTLGVFGVSVLGTVSAGTRSTALASERTAHLYAAEAGMDGGYASLRDDDGACTYEHETESWEETTINGAEVEVSCRWLSGGEPTTSGTGILAPYSLVTPFGGVSYPTAWTDLWRPLSTTIFGDAYWASEPAIYSLIHTMTIDGKLSTAHGCPSGLVTVTGGCTSGQGIPSQLYDLDLDMTVTQSSPQSSITRDGCTFHYPGMRTSSLSLSSSGKHYFASGIYYFRDANLTLAGAVFGGNPAHESQQQLTDVSPCGDDARAKSLRNGYTRDGGSGVTFVFGGSSTLTVANNADVELFPRVPGTSDANTRPGVSIFASSQTNEIRPGQSYRTSNVSSSSNVVTIGTGSNVVIHGLTYVPTARTALSFISNSDASDSSVFRGGITTAHLTMTNAATGVTTPIAGIPASPTTPRTVALTSTATPLDGGTATRITATVVPDERSVTDWRVSDA